MKKLLFSFSAIAFCSIALSACNGTTETKTETTTAETTTTTAEKPASESLAASDAPDFSSPEVNQNLAQFKSLKEEYIKALESRDPVKINNFVVKYSEWEKGAVTWASKLKPEEAKAYGDYMAKLSKEWSEASMKAVAH